MKTTEEIKKEVKEKYSQVARDNVSCCDPATGCCGTDIPIAMIGDEYETKEGYLESADLKLGCGLPTETAGLKAGDTVVDLGSGAGNDCFVARAEVGEKGKVIGVDFSEDMISLARNNVQKMGFNNIEFVYGEIEKIPLPDEVADVVVSNCVMNLIPNKEKAFAETFRILKKGGHFSISDIVYEGDMPVKFREMADLYTGCVSGAVAKDAYLKTIESAGFKKVDIPVQKEIVVPQEVLDQFLSKEEQTHLSSFKVLSITVNAEKTDEACCGPSCC